jgi:cobalt-zinc-cadmium efflux system membrane fusion protein
MQTKKSTLLFAGLLLIMAVAGVSWGLRDRMYRAKPADAGRADDGSMTSPSPNKKPLEILELGSQARKNLHLISKAVRPTEYWRTITVPGVIQDRPGVSDRGVTSPAIGAVADIHVYPGDTVRPGERLVTIRLFSEYLQATQTQLFTSSQEIELLQSEIDRLSGIAIAGGISKSRLIELENDVRRQTMLVKSTKQELLNRGLSPEEILKIASGSFVSSIDVVAPPPRATPAESQSNDQDAISQAIYVASDSSQETLAYEVQELAVELGQTVQAGQLIAALANHRFLYVVGHAFKREASFLERAAQEGRSIEVEFSDDSSERWEPLNQTFEIRHLSNTIDPESRTFEFFVPLENQSRSYIKDEETFLVWRFRPGQRTRIHIPIEKLENVFVLPSEAVAHEGPEAFVYRQNGDLFNQISVNVLHEDRRHVVIANDGSLTPGTFIAQNAGESLRRVLKSQSASGVQPGLHVHADGTVHAAH